MIVTYIRSSSFGCHEMCPMKFYLEYNLGWKGPSNIKAEKGTIVHKVLELLAEIKLQKQNNRTYFTDKVVGRVYVDKYDLDVIIQKCTDYYMKYSPNQWKPLDVKHCSKWTYKAIEYKGGEYDPRNSHIIKAEQAFDFEVNRPWAMYDYEMPDGSRLEGLLALKGTMDQISKIDDETYQILDWKGLPIDTKLPTPAGWTTMGEVRVGDTVFDKDGNKTLVIGKSKLKHKPCYKITFDDAKSVVCDDEHLWYLDSGETVSITCLEPGDKIDVAKPLQADHVELPIDPYLLGVWLGDGRNRSMEITSEDEFIFQEIEKRGYVLGVNLEKRLPYLQCRTVLKQTGKLRELGLLNNKHIPAIYLRASYQQRLDLLRGLMDTDGNVNPHRKQVVFTSCNKKLSDDVQELMVSLGQRVNQASIVRTTNFSKGKLVHVFPLHFRPVNINPFLLPRKSNRVDVRWGPGLSDKRRIVTIELLPEHNKTQCIMVDSPTNTYLCTEHMIPTHNTGRRLNWATGDTYDYEALMKNHQLMMYYYAARHLYPDIPNIQLVIYYINDGGPYTICFSDTDMPRIEDMLQKKFEEIRDTQIPALKKSWKCTKFCHFGMTTFDNTSVLPIIEMRHDQVTVKGKTMTKCEQTKYCLEHRSVESVAKNMTAPDFHVNKYDRPGEIKK